MNLEEIKQHGNQEEWLKKHLPIVQSSFQPSKYERLLLTILRDERSSLQEFRSAAHRLGEMLIVKLVECFETTPVNVTTPVADCPGEVLEGKIELLSIMRAGDALLNLFIDHFPSASISKILIQRDEETALPLFKYCKLSSTLADGQPVIIIEPMIATGGTLELVVRMLKERGVKEGNIIVVCLCAAPEGLWVLTQFPLLRVILSVMDEKLNEKKYIVPGLGDFGDRYFGN